MGKQQHRKKRTRKKGQPEQTKLLLVMRGEANQSLETQTCFPSPILPALQLSASHKDHQRLFRPALMPRNHPTVHPTDDPKLLDSIRSFNLIFIFVLFLIGTLRLLLGSGLAEGSANLGGVSSKLDTERSLKLGQECRVGNYTNAKDTLTSSA